MLEKKRGHEDAEKLESEYHTKILHLRVAPAEGLVASVVTHESLVTTQRPFSRRRLPKLHPLAKIAVPQTFGLSRNDISKRAALRIEAFTSSECL